jgi:hypothetical protein
MDIDLILLGAFHAGICVFIAVILLQRAQWRRKNRANKGRRAFYPSAALSLAILSLQTLAQPDLHHALEQRQSEADDEEEDGDPDDAAAQLSRQLKRIRNGEQIGTLRIPWRVGS